MGRGGVCFSPQDRLALQLSVWVRGSHTPTHTDEGTPRLWLPEHLLPASHSQNKPSASIPTPARKKFANLPLPSPLLSSALQRWQISSWPRAREPLVQGQPGLGKAALGKTESLLHGVCARREARAQLASLVSFILGIAGQFHPRGRWSISSPGELVLLHPRENWSFCIPGRSAPFPSPGLQTGSFAPHPAPPPPSPLDSLLPVGRWRNASPVAGRIRAAMVSPARVACLPVVGCALLAAVLFGLRLNGSGERAGPCLSLLSRGLLQVSFLLLLL